MSSFDGKDVVKLAADLAAGTITQSYIRRNFGDGVLSAVLSIGGGIGVGVLANALLNTLDDETGIVSDLGNVVDDIFNVF